MKKCKYCGAELLDEAVFCSQCGMVCEPIEEENHFLPTDNEPETSVLAEDGLETSVLEENEIETSVLEVNEPETTVLEETEPQTSVLEEDELKTAALKTKEQETTVLSDAQQETTLSETVSTGEDEKKAKKRKMIIIIVLICVGLACVIYGICVSDTSESTADVVSQDNESYNAAETQQGEVLSGSYNGINWYIEDWADENGINMKGLIIDGKGILDNDFFLNSDITTEIDYINISGKIDIQFTQSSSVFNNVTEVLFDASVEHIGYDALLQFHALKTVWVYNKDCVIDFEDDEGIYETLGQAGKGIDIACFRGSTAEKYVNVWNDSYENSYEIGYFTE